MTAGGKAGKLIDRLTGSASTKYVINQFIKDYGKLTALRIDSRKKSISATILLNGENSSIDLKIREYVVIRENASVSLLIRDAATNRPWLNAVLEKHIIGRPWIIPGDKALLLADFLG